MKDAVTQHLTIPGEPLIYSRKFNVANRTYTPNYFKNKAWTSLLKAQFISYNQSFNIPVVLIIRFYVSPPEYIKISEKDVAKERTIATAAFEICDYLLAFMEMLLGVLINTYKQFVKIDAEKYYSNNPRTVFQFMKWEHYVNFQNHNPLDTKAKSKRPPREVGNNIQPIQQGDAASSAICDRPLANESPSLNERPAICHSTLSDTSTKKPARKKKKTTAPDPAHKEA